MSDYRKELIENLFQNIIDYLEKKDDGSYTFKNNKFQFSSSTLASNLDDDELKAIPSIEELCEHFEKKILSIIPHATLFINDNLSITVNIERNPVLLKKVNLAEKQLDIYESLKTLFFPTLREFIVKFDNSDPEFIYSPYRKYNVQVHEIDKDKKRFEIRFVSQHGYRVRTIENAGIAFLIEDINTCFSELKLRNPIPINAIKLPQKDITAEDLNTRSERKRKGFRFIEFYSYHQKLKYIKKLFIDFLAYYPDIINNNFPRIKNTFLLFNDLPIKITIYTKKSDDFSLNLENIHFTYTFEKLPKGSKNAVELRENQEFTDDYNKYLRCVSTGFSSLLHISQFGGFHFYQGFSTSTFQNPHLAFFNALTFTYRYLREELDEILEKIQSDTIFDEINPFVSHAETWVQMIINAEKRGNEDYNIELKRIPTESQKKDGSGNDIYSEINAFENRDGGYLFIGVDENKKGIEKIVGLEKYFSDNNKNVDMVKREIIDKCIKYLGRTYRIDSAIYEGKSLIRIKVSSNYGYVSWFRPDQGNPWVYIRENGKKRILEPGEIEKRLRF